MKNFELPNGFSWLKEEYVLKNDQGLNFVANILSPSGAVLSLFEAQQHLGSAGLDVMIHDYGKITNNLSMKKKFNIKLGEKSYPIYIIEGLQNSLFAQGVIEKEKLYVLISFLNENGKDFKDFSQKNPVLGDMVEIMRKNK